MSQRFSERFKDFLLRVYLYLTVLAVGLSGGWLLFHRYSSQAANTIDELSEQNQVLMKKHERLRYINNLAVEFSMDPYIVTLVDRYAWAYVKKGGPEWRLIRTPEFMTYIMLSVIRTESKGNPDAVGDSGRARGLTQIWASTAQAYGEVTASQLHDPETNLAYSFKHFHHLLRKYDGNLALALYGWNRGPGTVDKLVDYGKPVENDYGRKVYQAARLNNGAERLNDYKQLIGIGN